MLKRKILTSRDTSEIVSQNKTKKLEVYSVFPVDRHDCACQKEVIKLKNQLAETHPDKRSDFLNKLTRLTCPRDKSGMTHKVISCKNCSQVQGFVWATDDALSDWCDFHYFQWTDGNEWFGCLTPNVSVIDGRLGLECTCGFDTRDFRANMTLPVKVAMDVEKSNEKGRRFGVVDSKFDVKNV